MKNIITALNNPTLNIEIKKEKNLKILCKDIQYQDGVIEILEKYKKIDFLIISELLDGKYKIEELINKIKEKNKIIKIIIILENKKEELENLLYSKGVYKIFYNNEINIKNIIDILKESKNREEELILLKDELKNIKQILLENNIRIDFNNEKKINIDNREFVKKIIKEKINNNIFIKKIINKKSEIKNNCSIISILGTGGVGKSIITINLAKYLKDKNKKILIIDFDILNNSLHTILGVDKYPSKIKKIIKKNNLIKNKINIKNLLIKINSQIDLISGINLLFDSKYKISSQKIRNILEELKKYYNYIIIDNSSECFLEYTKNIILNSNYSIFLLESNLLEIKKSKSLLEIYINNWNIEKNKIKILINKYNKNSIDENIIKNIFKEYEILGKIKFSEKYNILINENFNNIVQFKNINNEYKKILKNMKIKI